ncbi:MAG: carboxypeptidase M32 [Spirochaetales bacterium]|nr:carboxypeptidase M32 [Spirochaetales bacterium]
MGENIINLIKEKEQVIKDLQHIQSLLGWDQETGMPAAASGDRARQEGLIQSILSSHLEDESWEEWLPELAGHENTDFRSWQRILGKRYRQNKVLPPGFMSRFVETSSLSRNRWLEAREADDFSLFAPALEQVVELLREMCVYQGYEDEPYNALLDRYEPGITAASLDTLFSNLQSELTVLMDKALSGPKPESKLREISFPADFQKKVSLRILENMGYDFDAGRLDESVHPFTTTLGSRDIRLTTAFHENDFISGLSSTIHEGGHGLYEQNLPLEWFGTAAAEASSFGFHESQSRLWENIVGRSRPFSRYLSRIMKEIDPAFDFEPELLYSELIRVERSLIRVDADEVSYNLHIILRFRLERDLVNGSIEVKDLPGLWNSLTEELLGVKNSSDRLGILQDIHWTGGDMGYFPTYTLGNLYASQIWDALVRELPDTDGRVEKGNFTGIRDWLRERVHSKGALLEPNELMESVTGRKPDASFFIEYLKEKYGQ